MHGVPKQLSPSPTPDSFASTSVQESVVSRWLSDISNEVDLIEYEPILVQNGFDNLHSISLLTQDDLTGVLGIKLGHALIIRQGVTKLKESRTKNDLSFSFQNDEGDNIVVNPNGDLRCLSKGLYWMLFVLGLNYVNKASYVIFLVNLSLTTWLPGSQIYFLCETRKNLWAYVVSIMFGLSSLCSQVFGADYLRKTHLKRLLSSSVFNVFNVKEISNKMFVWLCISWFFGFCYLGINVVGYIDPPLGWFNVGGAVWYNFLARVSLFVGIMICIAMCFVVYLVCKTHELQITELKTKLLTWTKSVDEALEEMLKIQQNIKQSDEALRLWLLTHFLTNSAIVFSMGFDDYNVIHQKEPINTEDIIQLIMYSLLYTIILVAPYFWCSYLSLHFNTLPEAVYRAKLNHRSVFHDYENTRKIVKVFEDEKLVAGFRLFGLVVQRSFATLATIVTFFSLFLKVILQFAL